MKKASRVFFTLTIMWMIVIFIFSAQSGEDSGSMSGRVTEVVISVIYGDYDSYSIEKQSEIFETIHYIIRKGAHFTEYAILGILSVMTALTRRYSKKEKNALIPEKNSFIYIKSGIGAFAFSSVYALSDEFHQNFVAERAPGIKDVLIDSSGALAGILFVCVIFKIYMSKQKEFSIL